MAKKLIEVALPLEEINKASAREKSIRHGHPSTLHLWWARRPLAAARAVIFSSLITDPGDPEYPWKDGQERDVEKERGRLHQLIVDLVQWENTTNETVLNKAREEILHHTDGNPPPLLDPFAGGGAIPLEAQRLGLEAHASDLNPVAVLINKAMIEIPPKFAGQPPVNPEQRNQMKVAWKGAAGLAEDVRYYGKWMRDEAERRIGHLYPRVQLPKEQGGGEATVIAWLWARTVTCPNPACGAEMPLVRSFTLSNKKGREAHIVHQNRPDNSGVEFQVRMGRGQDHGTVNRNGARCLVCEASVPFPYLRAEGAADRMGHKLFATVGVKNRKRIYVTPDPLQMEGALVPKPTSIPQAEISHWPGRTNVVEYGMTHFSDLFTNRQLTALTTLADLVDEARGRIFEDSELAGRPSDYSTAVSTYLGLAVSRLADIGNSLCTWKPSMDQAIHVFTRQAIPMTWDFAETQPFSGAAGDFGLAVNTIAKVIDRFPSGTNGYAEIKNAVAFSSPVGGNAIVSTDPPYYDNVGYADLSDFFYVWLDRSLSPFDAELFSTLQVPKEEELVAKPYRFARGKKEADAYFEAGLQSAFASIAQIQSEDIPATVFYAFKQIQSDARADGSIDRKASGWETMLEGLIVSGFQITGTWPMRTEMANRSIASGANALASSIVLACRVRPVNAPEATRQQFLRENAQ